MDAYRAMPLEIKPKLPLSEAFQQILAECIRHVGGNAALVTTNSKAVHQMRVSLRRTRSAIALFKPHLDSSERKVLNQQMRDLGNTLSSSRDWDVFIDETLPRVQKQIPLDDQAVTDMRSQATQRRLENDLTGVETTWQTISERLRSLNMVGDDVDEAIEDIAPDLLGKEARRVRRCIKHIETPEQRHSLRKAMKRLRYSAEFLESLYRHKAVMHYLDRCKDCHDVLGQMNDNATTIKLCRELDNEASHRIIELVERQEAQAIRHLAEPLGKYRSTKPYWH